MELLKELKEAVEALEAVLTAPEHQMTYQTPGIMTPNRSEILIKLPKSERIAVEKTYWRLKEIVEASL